MTIQEFAQLLRARWVIICATILAAVVGVGAYTMLATPLYEASTKLFVSTATAGKSPYEAYQGVLFTQERVALYTKLLTGEALAQRTVDKRHLDVSAASLQAKVRATSAATALIDVSVRDTSPVQARDIADALSDEFVVMARQLETTDDDKRDARVVVQQRASVPERPVYPNTTRNLQIALVLGVLLGVGLALLRHWLDNTVKDRDVIEGITGVRLVGFIPFDKVRRKTPAISFDSDSSAIAESFRKIRTNLQFLMPDDPPHVIVVTSSMPNEGKSTAAINIALALAEAEQNVVLVDGNLRRPRLDKYLHLVASSGFSTVLAGRASLNEVLQQTEFERLALLTSGPVPPNPSELLGSQAATKVFNDLRAQFDYVIVDSSPLVVTDAAVLAADADGVLVVAQYGQTKRDQLAHAIRNLQDVAAPILGAIFTKAPTRGSKSYSDSYEGDGSTPSNVRSTKRERQRSRNPLRSRGGRHTPNSTRDAHKF